MQRSLALSLLSSVAVYAQTGTPTTNAAATPAVTAAASGNPFKGYQAYANGYYSSEIYNSAIPSMSSGLAAKASEVAEVPSFVWL